MNPDQVVRDAANAGKILESGWLALKALAVPPNASQVQIEECRKFFYAGAHHLFASLFTLATPEGGTDYLKKIHNELDLFFEELEAK